MAANQSQSKREWSMTTRQKAPLSSHFRERAEQERDRASRAPNERHKRLHLELAAIFERRAAGDPM
ncbi:hypothetical protein DD559_09380 [Sphingomonas pokkalii]|uniref:Uncharacterized protein n=1 Tax=Sphingomonas pokkalii TaxID=2175090 RepID=A0A2U0SDU8_9SPHN|nr:hypothetical protein DD559_09380 [Sphingomonas pokkalii]